MQFTEKSSANNIIAGRAAAQQALDFFVTSRENSPDFTTIAMADADGRSNMRSEAVKNKLQVTKRGFVEEAGQDMADASMAAKTRNEDKKRHARRFAGVAGIGMALGQGAMWKKINDKEKAERQAHWDRQDALKNEILSAIKLNNEGRGQTNNFSPYPGLIKGEDGQWKVDPNFGNTAPSTPPATPPGSGSTPQPPGSVQKMSYTPGSGQDYLTGDWLKAAQEVASLEASGNYNAYNQGGRTEFEPINSGDYKSDWGRDMTSMTINEVMEKQSGWNDRSITDAQWRASAPGKIHAAGGFQFIGPTLPGVVRRAGIDPNSKFDIPTQQKLFKFHALEVGGFHPWSATKGKGLEQKYAHLFGAV